MGLSQNMEHIKKTLCTWQLWNVDHDQAQTDRSPQNLPLRLNSERQNAKKWIEMSSQVAQEAAAPVGRRGIDRHGQRAHFFAWGKVFKDISALLGVWVSLNYRTQRIPKVYRDVWKRIFFRHHLFSSVWKLNAHVSRMKPSLCKCRSCYRRRWLFWLLGFNVMC